MYNSNANNTAVAVMAQGCAVNEPKDGQDAIG